ncbi:MAG TPA: GAF domain-containing protein, partial [Chloroflexota bacterium]|nr:GAF domain-containing protein [Chloroflexota bacterium]
MREIGDADIVALYPYDEETEAFYAPVALGLPEDDLVRALPDMADQLRRFHADRVEGKIPDELQPAQYGPNAWLLTIRRPLVSADAAREVDNSFIRRHKIQALIGLPLVVAGHLVGLLYLNYSDRGPRRKPRDVTAAPFLERVERAAVDVAVAIDTARRTAESATLCALGEMVGEFSAAPASMAGEGAVAQRLEVALNRVLAVTSLEAAALYRRDEGGTHLNLVASCGNSDIAARASTLPVASPDVVQQAWSLALSASGSALHPLATLTPRGQGHQTVLVLADHDPLALQRRPPLTRVLLQTAADLLSTMLNNGRLISALDETNRTLGAVTRLSTRLLQPGATQAQALQTAMDALTDPALPELDFEFAAIFLLEATPDGTLQVCASAGATASPAIDAVPLDQRQAGTTAGGAPPAERVRRVPRWVAQQDVRVLDPHDVLAYVARRRRAVVIA